MMLSSDTPRQRRGGYLLGWCRLWCGRQRGSSRFLSSGRGLGGDGLSGRSFRNHCQYIANANGLALLLENLLKNTPLFGKNLLVDLIGLQFHQDFTLSYRLAFAFAPGSNCCLNNRFPKSRNTNLN